MLNYHQSKNNKNHPLIGQTITLASPMVDGKGTIEIMGQTWDLSGQNMPANTIAKILDVQGSTLKVFWHEDSLI